MKEQEAAAFRDILCFFLGNHLVDHQQLGPILRASDVENYERRNHVRVKEGSENLEKGNLTLLL